MTILPWRKRDLETEDFVFSFEPRIDITPFELATVIRLGLGDVHHGRGFKVAPIDLKHLAEQTGSAFRHLHQWDAPARESWPIKKYRPALKRAA